MNKQKAYELGRDVAQSLNDEKFSNGMYNNEAIGLILGFINGITEGFAEDDVNKAVVKSLFDQYINYDDNSLAFDLAPKCLDGVIMGGDLTDIEDGLVKLTKKAIKEATGGGW